MDKRFDHRDLRDAVLVTGGSGFIGRKLVAKLAESSKSVVCMYHQRLPDPMANVYPVCSDIGSPELIMAPLRGVTTVVHLAWANNLLGPTEKTDWNPFGQQLTQNIQITKNLIQACEKAGVRRFIFLSCLGASRQAQQKFLQEKYLAEFLALNSSIPERIVARTGLVYSGSHTNDKLFQTVANLASYPMAYPVPSANLRVHPTHVDDLSNFLLKLVSTDLDPASPASILEFVSGEEVSVRDIFTTVSKKLGPQTKFQLRGFWGNMLLPLFERKPKKGSPPSVPIRNLLAVANQKANEDTARLNPLSDLLQGNPSRRFADI